MGGHDDVHVQGGDRFQGPSPSCRRAVLVHPREAVFQEVAYCQDSLSRQVNDHVPSSVRRTEVEEPNGWGSMIGQREALLEGDIGRSEAQPPQLVQVFRAEPCAAAELIDLVIGEVLPIWSLGGTDPVFPVGDAPRELGDLLGEAIGPEGLDVRGGIHMAHELDFVESLRVALVPVDVVPVPVGVHHVPHRQGGQLGDLFDEHLRGGRRLMRVDDHDAPLPDDDQGVGEHVAGRVWLHESHVDVGSQLQQLEGFLGMERSDRRHTDPKPEGRGGPAETHRLKGLQSAELAQTGPAPGRRHPLEPATNVRASAMRSVHRASLCSGEIPEEVGDRRLQRLSHGGPLGVPYGLSACVMACSMLLPHAPASNSLCDSSGCRQGSTHEGGLGPRGWWRRSRRPGLTQRFLALALRPVIALEMASKSHVTVRPPLDAARFLFGDPRPRWLLLGLGLVVMAACGPSLQLEPPPPSAIPGLEAEVENDPTDTDALLELAAAYRGAERPDDARVLLERGRTLDPDDPAVPVLLGLTYEDLGEFGLARDVYLDVLGGGDGQLDDVVRDRLDVIAGEELRASVRDALARESELSSLPPTPNTVGVFPFRVEGDPDLEPLSRAMAEFLVTDLSIVGRLQVLERVRVQTLLTEIALGEGGWTEPETAARAGRLLSAERIVQGTIDARATGLRIDAAVVRVGDEPTTGDPVVVEGTVEALFDMEKEVALGLYAEMGVALTSAERARINERPTESVQALLAYGRGLEASDRGDFTTAGQEFAEAANLDPGFQMAQLQLQNASQVANARNRSSPQAARRAARLNRARQVVRRIRRNPAGLRPAALKNLTDRQRAVLSEVLGQDRLGKLFLLEIVFRPGG